MVSGRWTLLVAILAIEVHSHTVITYPGWRGNNLIVNETFPYGMQWLYPCESFPLPTWIDGPSNNPYPGTFCLPQVPIPTNLNVKVGDLGTIQVIETAVHGRALYNCVDITLTEESDVTPLAASNCFNSTTITFKDPFAAESRYALNAMGIRMPKKGWGWDFHLGRWHWVF
ncbi:hypothetical protein BDZ45DRAFT_770144 [Acephala macrosclerotiorum]|nr:hypothetical protein BDZ45DRAFT_770144 [Acephala macrosclerotiorum]